MLLHTKRKFIFFILICCSFALEAATLTLEEISKKPPCRARDFFIWEYLSKQKNLTKEEVKKAYKLVVNKNNYKLKKIYQKFFPQPQNTCPPLSELIDSNNSKCIKKQFSLYKAYQLTPMQRVLLSLNDALTSRQKMFLNIQEEAPLIQNYFKYDPNDIIIFLLNIPKKDYIQHLDYQINSKFIFFLSKAKRFGRFVDVMLQRDKAIQTQKVLLKLPYLAKLSSMQYFQLALKSIDLQNEKKAIQFLKYALKNATNSFQKDRSLFWLYLITKQKTYLQTLLQSKKINFYTAYVHDLTNTPFYNYINTIAIQKQKKDIPYNIQNPFDWYKLSQKIRKTPKQELQKLANELQDETLLPALAIIYEKMNHYKKYAYITPYKKYITSFPKQKQILIYAIMRQESFYVPSAISSSFALGLMQIMPFLVEALAKQQKENLQSFTSMFQVKKNLQYATLHLAWLEKHLKHPLYIAYAYNGGYGFLRKYRKKYDFHSHKYDPFFSMEMMRNSESREYGKKVFTNYFIYSKIYNYPFSMVESLKNLP